MLKAPQGARAKPGWNHVFDTSFPSLSLLPGAHQTQNQAWGGSCRLWAPAFLKSMRTPLLEGCRAGETKRTLRPPLGIPRNVRPGREESVSCWGLETALERAVELFNFFPQKPRQGCQSQEAQECLVNVDHHSRLPPWMRSCLSCYYFVFQHGKKLYCGFLLKKVSIPALGKKI